MILLLLGFIAMAVIFKDNTIRVILLVLFFMIILANLLI